MKLRILLLIFGILVMGVSGAYACKGYVIEEGEIQNIRLPIISKPAEGTRVVFEIEPGRVIKGGGNTGGNINYLCGSCGQILVQRVKEGAISDVVLHCPCGSYNDLR